MTLIKICGITNREDGVEAAKLNADMLGFVFYKNSKRYVEPETVKAITGALPPFVGKVGVFVDEEKARVSEIAEICRLDLLQFHGSESPEYCAAFKEKYGVIKAFRIKDKESLAGINGYDTRYYMLDAYLPGEAGGTGRKFDWEIIKGFKFSRPIILSGGLTPENVAQAIKEVSPCGVDVSSAVELSPGRKDLGKLKRFIENARNV